MTETQNKVIIGNYLVEEGTDSDDYKSSVLPGKAYLGKKGNDSIWAEGSTFLSLDGVDYWIPSLLSGGRGDDQYHALYGASTFVYDASESTGDALKVFDYAENIVGLFSVEDKHIFASTLGGTNVLVIDALNDTGRIETIEFLDLALSGSESSLRSFLSNYKTLEDQTFDSLIAQRLLNPRAMGVADANEVRQIIDSLYAFNNANIPGITDPIIGNGSFQEGVTLSAGSISGDPDGNGTITAYQWFRNGTAITGGAESDYAVPLTGGGTYKVAITYTDGLGYQATVESPEQVVSIFNNGNASPATITGNSAFREGVTLSAPGITGDPDGDAVNPNYAYQWFRNGTAITDATASTYVVPVAGFGTYKVAITYTDAQGFTATVDSPNQDVSTSNWERESLSLLRDGIHPEQRIYLSHVSTPSRSIDIGSGNPFRTTGERLSSLSAHLTSNLFYILAAERTNVQRPTSLAHWSAVIYSVNGMTRSSQQIDLDSLIYSQYGQSRTLARYSSYTSTESLSKDRNSYTRFTIKHPFQANNTAVFNLRIDGSEQELEDLSEFDALKSELSRDFRKYKDGISTHFTFDQRYSDPANGYYVSSPTQFGYLYDDDTEIAFTLNNPNAGSISSQALWISQLEANSSFVKYPLSTKGFEPTKIWDCVESGGATYVLLEGTEESSGITEHRIYEVSINEAPQTNDLPLPDQILNRGEAFSYMVPSDLFSDTDSTLTLSATTSTGTALPSWLSFNPATRTLSGTPTTGGTLNLNLSASDELGSVSTPLSIKVREVQQLSSSTPTIRYQRNKDFTLPINYSTTDGSSSTGLAFKVHFNSSLFSFNPSTGVSNKAQADLFQIGAVQQDTADTDNDPTTDRFIPISIASFSGQFPSGSAPSKLADLTFRSADKAIDPITGLRDTSINFSESSVASGYGFSGSSASLKPLSFSLDVDGDGLVTPLGDGLMVIRYLFGNAFVGDALINKAISPDSPLLGGIPYASMTTQQKLGVASLVATNIQQGIDSNLLDVDKDGMTTPLGDGLMVIRRLFGTAFEGSALTSKAISPESPYFGPPADFAAVAANIDALKPTMPVM